MNDLLLELCFLKMLREIADEIDEDDGIDEDNEIGKAKEADKTKHVRFSAEETSLIKEALAYYRDSLITNYNHLALNSKNSKKANELLNKSYKVDALKNKLEK